MDKYILAHDLGTSSNKACLFNERGQVVAEETVNYTTYYGKNGEAEQAHVECGRHRNKTRPRTGGC